MLAVATMAQAQPALRWLLEVYDFGAFNEDAGKVTAVFRAVNTGTEPLVVTDARATCGCTTPHYDVVPVAPGDTLRVSVSYDPQGRPGRFKKYVYVYTNAPGDGAKSRLTVKGVVIGAPSTVSARYPVDMGPMRFDRRASLLGTVKKGHVKMFTHKGYNMSADSLTTTVRRTPKWLEVTATPPVTPPGEITTFNFYVMSDKTPLYGVVTDTITIVPDSRHPEQGYDLPVVVTFEEDFSKMTDKELAKAPVVRVAEERANLGAVEAGRDLTATFRVENTGRSPLQIRRAYSTDPSVTATVSDKSVKPGRQAEVTVTVAADAVRAGRPVNARVQLVTNSPVQPVTTLRLTAEPR